jgi:hypothetical protein
MEGSQAVSRLMLLGYPRVKSLVLPRLEAKNLCVSLMDPQRSRSGKVSLGYERRIAKRSTGVLAPMSEPRRQEWLVMMGRGTCFISHRMYTLIKYSDACILLDKHVWKDSIRSSTSIIYRLLAHASESRKGILEMPCRIVSARSCNLANRRACISSAHFRSYVPTGGSKKMPP